jgi:hypothetical protein
MAEPRKCANSVCSAVCRHEEGTLFCLDIGLANMAGEFRSKTMFFWLCAQCARQMKPKVEIVGDTVKLLLTPTMRPPGT